MAPNDFSRPMMKAMLFIMLYTFAASVVKAQVVRPDSSFGNNGLFIIHPDSIFSSATILKVLPAKGGNSYVFYQVGFNQFYISKYLKIGVLDTSFGNKGYTQSEILTFTDALIQPDGKIVVAGRAQISSPYDDIKIFRYNTSGIRDATFGNNGLYTYSADFTSLDAVNGLKLQGDSIVFSTHSISNALGINTFGIQVLNTNGTLIKIFATGNAVSTAHPGGSNNIIISQGNKYIVYLSGIFGTTDGFYRYNANGSLDSSFGLNGILVVSIIPKTVLIDQNGKLFVGGSIDGGLTFTVLARYNNDGTPDSSFNGTGKQSISVSKMALQQDKILVAGFNSISRLNNVGSFDLSFGTNGVLSTGKLYNLDELLVDSNKFYTAGYFQLDSNSNVFRAIAAYILENPVTLSCTTGKVVTTDKGKCSAVVNGIDPVIMPGVDFSIIKYQLSGATLGVGTGTVSGKIFNKGITTIWYSLAADSTKTCSFTITVEDHEAPVITQAEASPNTLWPADHKLKEIEINYQLSDNCGGASAMLSVVSDEPDSGINKEDIPHDWQIVDAHHVWLRAERSNKGNGRIYTITITATDASGNKSVQKVIVKVPLDERPDPGNKLEVSIYPNPTKNYFNILTETNNNKQLITIKILDIHGRIREVKSMIAPNSIVQLGGNYHAGLYFAECIQGNQKVVAVLLKL